MLHLQRNRVEDKGKFLAFLFQFWEAQKFEDRSLSLPKLRFKELNLSVCDWTNCPGILNTMLFFIPHFFINFHCKLLSAASAHTRNLSLAMCINISLTRTEICTRLPFNILMPGRLLARDVEVSISWGHYSMVTWIFLHFHVQFWWLYCITLYNLTLQMQGAKNATFTTCHSGKL